MESTGFLFKNVIQFDATDRWPQESAFLKT